MIRFLLADLPLLAESDLPQLAPQPSGDYGAAFAKMFLTMTALILLLGVTFWFLRKIIQQRMQKGNSNAAIQILEKRMISPKTMLYLIEVEGKKTLIAESHLEIRNLGEKTSSDSHG